MDTYSVKDIAGILNKDEETIRRWIREGKLKADGINSKKEGFRVTESMMKTFFRKSPKYAGAALTSTAASLITGGVAIAASVIAGALVQGVYDELAIQKARIDLDEVILLLKKEQENRKDKIRDNEVKIEKIMDSIKEEEKKIDEIEELIKIINIHK